MRAGLPAPIGVLATVLAPVCCDCAGKESRPADALPVVAAPSALPVAAPSASAVPSLPPLPSNFVPAEQIAAGGEHTCVVLADRTVRCWGGVATREFGVDVPSGIAPPTLVPGWKDIALVGVGASTVCAVKKSGEASWLGDLDVGPQVKANGPRSLPLTSVSMLAAGDSHWCALRPNGEVLCWGDNGFGESGSGAPSGLVTVTKESDIQAGPAKKPRVALTPVRVPDVAGARQIAAGGSTSCALMASGTASCWGDGSDGQLGDGGSSGGPKARAVAGLADVAQIALGNAHACARHVDGSVSCWGGNAKSELGRAPSQAKYTPTKIDAVRDVIALAAGGARTCVLERGGTVRCWGDGVATPTAVVGLEQPVAIALGSRHACALDRLGVVSCWGAGDAGQLGCGGCCPADATARRVTW